MNTKTFRILLSSLFIGFTGIAQKYSNTESATITKQWNKSTFSSSKTFVENIENSSEFSMLKKALENSKSLTEIETEEMVTIFAISNQGFNEYQETQDSIFGTANTKNLSAILKYHVIPGRVDSYSLKKAISKNGLIAYFATLQGEKLGIKIENEQLILIDSKGNTSIISATDFYHKNGFFHIVDGIVFPNN